MPSETRYKAERDLSFVAAGKTFTEAKVPAGVSLLALLRGGIVTIVRPAKLKKGEKGGDD